MSETSRLRVRHLEVLVEVARHRSVSRAADTLNMTQPAVSRTLRELEAVCGKPLVERDGRGIRISPDGEIFLRHAGASLAAVRGGLAALSEGAVGDGPPVRIGALPTVSTTIVPAAVDLYLRQGRGNRLRIASGDQDLLLDRLRRGGLDLVVGRLPAPEDMEGLAFEPLTHDRVVFVVHRDHPLAAPGAGALDGMAHYPVLLPPRGSIIRPMVDRLFVEHGIPEPPRAVETVSDSFGRTFVRRFWAVWIISRGVVLAEIDSGEFRPLAIDTTSTLGAVGLTTRAGVARSAAAEVFIEAVRKVTVR
ncbi:pca operon transcription factor PcaQ [Acuticoccus mangrovi]|uniref:Pca operon transcription factor PcaQ n=1 Tax=Acuticoccus mangrovi TaxID=2796142 RepID=A0A934IF86_9HYPH|nr:pca operon transcription factor PcaQ [Acuticoccus mangrovi]MBJ3775428.1 pca operon transcription factor PcaQ [Acuticoccus mangrovi]